MSERFRSDWLFVGKGHDMHWCFSHGRNIQTRCGIVTNKDRVYSGVSTSKCQRCLKSMQDSGKIKR